MFSYLKKKLSKYNEGQSLVELLVAIGLISVLLPALFAGFAASRSGRAQQQQRLKALALAREGEEAARVVREDNWVEFANKSGNTNYYPAVSGLSWALQPGTEPRTDGFTRIITISDVFRDGSGNIAQSGTLDPSIKKVTTTVSWTMPSSNSVTATEYLSRYGNTALSQNGTAQPPAGGGGSWCNPSSNIVGTPFNLGAIPIALTATTQSTQDLAYASTGNNRSSGTPVYGLSVSHASPPVVQSLASSPDNTKAYGIFSDGKYVYFTEANPGPTVRIANAGDLTDAGFFSAATKGPGSLFVVGAGGNPGTVGYAALGNKIYSFDLSTIKGSSSQDPISSSDLSGSAQKVIVFGTYVYVVTDSTSNQLQRFLITGPGTFGTRTDVSMGNGQAGVDLAIDPTGNYAYVVTNFASGQNDFFVVDTSDTSKKYGYTTHIASGAGAGDMNPRGVISVTDNKVIVVGCNADNGGDKCPVQSTGWNYQVFDLASGPASANRCGGMTPVLDGIAISGINAIAGVSQASGKVFSYIVDGINSTSEFQIVEGGTGAGGGSGNGIFESATQDFGYDVAFNYFSGTSDPNLSYKIAIKQAVGGVCPSFSDGDFVAISTGPIAIPGVGFSNPGQCMRYRVINSGSTAISYTISINYSL